MLGEGWDARTQVILSTAVFYTDTQATVNVNFDYAGEMSDLQSLRRALVEHASANHWLHHFKFNHSEIGVGEVL